MKGSKYSPKPPREICASEVARSRLALSGSPTRTKTHHKSQLKTGPRQYLRGWNSGCLGLALGGSGQRSPGSPAKSPRLSFVPEELVRNATRLRGAEGAEWANRLPAIVADCERSWSLEIGPPFPELSQNYVARADGTAAVLKLTFPGDPGFGTEAQALRLFDGRGIARLLELDPGRGAMLLERLEPGVPLDAVEDDEEAMSIAADVLRRLWRPAPADHPFPPVSDWARGLVRLRRHFGGGTGPLPAALVEEAEALFAELIPSQAERVLLHGDVHHGNVLAARRRPWLAIDPKGIVSEPAFDTGALLYNPVELLDAPRPGKVLERRIGQLAEELDLDSARVRGWGLSRAVLAAYWGWEDGGQVWEDSTHLRRAARRDQGLEPGRSSMANEAS